MLHSGTKRGRDEDDHYIETISHKPNTSMMIIDSNERKGLGKLNNFEQDIAQITDSSRASLVGISSDFTFNNITEYNNTVSIDIAFEAASGDFQGVDSDITFNIPVGYYTIYNLCEVINEKILTGIRSAGELENDQDIVDPTDNSQDILPVQFTYDDYNASTYFKLERESGLLGMLVRITQFQVAENGSAVGPVVDLQLNFLECSFFQNGNSVHGLSIYDPELRGYSPPTETLGTDTPTIEYRSPSPANMIASNYYAILSRQLTRGVKNSAIGLDGRAIGIFFAHNKQQGVSKGMVKDLQIYQQEKYNDPNTSLNPPLPDFFRYGNVYNQQFYPVQREILLELDSRKGVPSVDIQIVDDGMRTASIANASSGRIILFFTLTNY